MIPLYNKIKYIRRALDSVLDQTFQDFEIVVVNDGSTDGSEKVVELCLDPRIQLVHRKHINSGGGHAARNLGIAEARSDLIAFLDADDEWLPGHLDTILRLSGEFPQCGVYSTAFRIVTPRGEVAPSTAGIPAPPFEGVIPNYFHTVSGDHVICSSSVAIPRGVFDVCGAFPEGERRRGDIEMWCRIALKYSFAFSTCVGAIYHQEAQNRVRHGRPILGEPKIVQTLEAALATGRLPDGVTRTDLTEYRNIQLITRARSVLLNGYRRQARRMLQRASVTREHRGVLRRWRLLSGLPLPLLSLALRVRLGQGPDGRAGKG